MASVLLRKMLSRWVLWLLGLWPPGGLVQAKCIVGDGTVLDLWGSWGPAPSLGCLLPPAVAQGPLIPGHLTVPGQKVGMAAVLEPLKGLALTKPWPRLGAW